MFLTVPPIPAPLSAFAAASMSFCGTCRIFCAAPLFFKRCADALSPPAVPLRSTSVARPPPLVSASSRWWPGNGTSVFHGHPQPGSWRGDEHLFLPWERPFEAARIVVGGTGFVKGFALARA